LHARLVAVRCGDGIVVRHRPAVLEKNALAIVRTHDEAGLDDAREHEDRLGLLGERLGRWFRRVDLPQGGGGILLDPGGARPPPATRNVMPATATTAPATRNASCPARQRCASPMPLPVAWRQLSDGPSPPHGCARLL